MSIVSILFLILFAIICLGWTVLLGCGIYRKRRELAGGLVMIILGCIWAVPGIGIAGLAAFAIYQFSTWEPMEIAEFDPASYEGETGTITLDYDGPVTLQVTGTNNIYLRLAGDNGAIVAPVGKLTPSSFECKKEGKGGTWVASTWLGRRKARLTVTPDTPAHLDSVGPPFAASIKTRQKANGEISLDFKLQGKGKEQYTIRGPKRRLAPRFEIRDQRDEIALSGAFSYG